MQQETKIACYQKAYQLLKEMDNVTNLGYPDKKKNLEFACNIGDIQVEYNLRLKADLLTIRGTKKYPGLSDSELTEIGQKLVENKKFMFTAYNENVIFQLSIPIVSTADEDAMKKLDTETKAFFEFLSKNAGEVNVKKEHTPYIFDEFANGGNVPEFPTNHPSAQSPDVPARHDEVQNGMETHADEPGTNGMSDELDKKNDTKKEAHRPEVSDAAFEQPSYAESPIMSEPVINSESIQETDLEKEKRLVQLEWLAEKRVENKKKEDELNERETLISENELKMQKAEEVLQAKISEAEKNTEYWKSMKKECSDRERELDHEKQQLKLKEQEIFKKEEKIRIFEESYRSREDELLQRISDCSQKEQTLQRDRAAFDAACEESLRERQALNIEKGEFMANKQKILDENKSLKERCVSIQNELKEKENNIRELSKENAFLKEKAETSAPDDWAEREETYQKQVEELTNQKNELSRTLKSQSGEFECIRTELENVKKDAAATALIMNEKDSSIRKLEKEIELYKKSGTQMGTPDEILEDFAETRKRNRNLERELNDLKSEMKTSDLLLREQLQTVQTEKTEIIEKIEEEKRANLPENLAAAYIEALSSNGIILNQEIVNENVCLVGERDGCDILVNVNKKVIVIKKQMNRPNRLAAKLNEWNQNELTEMYFYDKRSISCKKVLNDIEIDVSKVLQKFKLLK